MQLGSCVSKVRSHVTEAPARCEGKRWHHDLQTVQTGATMSCYSTTSAQLTTPGHGYSGDATQKPIHHITGRVQYSRATRLGVPHDIEDIISYF
jgi:hypothetical protein